jgi:hypothetical protein
LLGRPHEAGGFVFCFANIRWLGTFGRNVDQYADGINKLVHDDLIHQNLLPRTSGYFSAGEWFWPDLLRKLAMPLWEESTRRLAAGFA